MRSFIIALLLTVFCSSVVRADTKSAAAPFGSVARKYLVHTPPNYSARKAYPMMIIFHGSNQSNSDIETISNFDAIADRDQFIVVYPETDPRTSNQWIFSGPLSEVNYINQEILPILERELNIDGTKIYAVGYGTGSGVVKELACTPPSSISGIGIVAEEEAAAFENYCTGAPPVSVDLFHGTADPVSPYLGATIHGLGTASLSAKETADFWAKIDQCGLAEISNLPDAIKSGSPELIPQTDELQLSSDGCANKTTVRLYSLFGAGHTWPGGTENYSQDLGPVSEEINASARIASDFLKLP